MPKPRTKICWIIPTLDQGGAEKQLVTLACHIDRGRFEPHVITLTRSGAYQNELEQAGVPLSHINKSGKFDPLALMRLQKLLRKIKPDVVHTWLFAANVYGRFAALRTGVPTVFGGERCVDPWKRTWELMIDRYLAKRTTGILTNSGGVRDFYVSKGVAAEKFTIIPNGIAPRKPSSLTREQALKRLSLPADTILIGSIGRLWLQKGYKELIWAAGMFTVVEPRCRYVIFGDGPLQASLEHFRDDTGAHKTISFAGHRDDMQDLLPHFDMFWNGSLYEGQSNSIMEAMQAGVPVLASDIAGNRDLITHDQTGFLFPVAAADQLSKLAMRLLKEPELRQRLTANAQARIAKDFSIEQMVQRHQQIYCPS